MKTNVVYNDDWLKAIKKIDDESIDFICIDPPYGKIMGMKLSGQKQNVDWDDTIDWEKMFTEFRRVIKKGGTIAVFGQQPTFSEMILSNPGNFKYEYIWEKNNGAQGYNADKMPLIYSENIAIFIEKESSKNKRTFNKPTIGKVVDPEEDKYFTRAYSKKLQEYIGLPRRKIAKILGHRKLEFFFYFVGSNFQLLSEDLYNELIKNFHIDKMDGFIKYKDLKKKWEDEKEFNRGIRLDAEKYGGTFTNVLYYPKDPKPYLHPTQKPIALMEELVSIYTNEGDIVLDCFAGSGSTLLAAKKLKRNYIGVERDKDFFKVIKKRLKD